MSAQTRFVPDSSVVHVLYRAEDRSRVFFRYRDYLHFYDLLLDAARRQGCRVHAYVLLSHRVQLLLTPATLSSPVPAGCFDAYADYVNARYRQAGAPWRAVVKLAPVADASFVLPCCCHIELSPVAEAIVSDPLWHAWSSYLGNARGEPDPLLEPHAAYRELAATARARQAAYRELVGQGLDAATDRAIRAVTRAGRSLGWVAAAQAPGMGWPVGSAPGAGAGRASSPCAN